MIVSVIFFYSFLIFIVLVIFWSVKITKWSSTYREITFTSKLKMHCSNCRQHMLYRYLNQCRNAPDRRSSLSSFHLSTGTRRRHHLHTKAMSTFHSDTFVRSTTLFTSGRVFCDQCVLFDDSIQMVGHIVTASLNGWPIFVVPARICEGIYDNTRPIVVDVINVDG